MKFTKNTFLMLGMASIFSIAWIGDGFGWANCTSAPDAGHFCKTAGSKPKCRGGCYCPGGNKTAIGTSINVDKSCEERKNESDLGGAGIFFCPSGFPLSPEGASKIEDCFFNSIEGTKVTIIGYSVDVPAGQYLPKNSVTPINCPTDESSRFCPGGKMTPYHDERVGVRTCPTDGKVSSDLKKCLMSCEAGEYLYLARNIYESINDTKCKKCPEGKVCEGVKDYLYLGIKNRFATPVGIKTCENDEKPNNDQTACISATQSNNQEETVHCIQGKYVPANSESCAECPDGYYCPNEKDYLINRAVSQGNERCTGNEVPNDKKDNCVPCSSGKEPDEDHATCVDAKIHVNAGEYLHANTTTPISCSGSVKKFCPGGSFYKKSVDQGKYDCPFNSNANANNTACELKLTKKQMVNGVSGKGECWLKTDPEDYKFCIYGIRFENASNTATE